MASKEKELQARIEELEALQRKVEESQIPTVFGVRLDQVGEVYDPYGAGQGKPLAFKDHPEGFKLRWCHEGSRASRGWKGWEPVFWDDEIGQNLEKYCFDAPRKLDNAIDAKVRRGDAILCKLPIGVWLSRQLARVEKARAQVARHKTEERDLINEYQSNEFGPGLTESERPADGFRMRPEHVSDRSDAFATRSLMEGSKAVDNTGEDNGDN